MSDLNTNITNRIPGRQPIAQVEVFQPSDFPAPSGGTITLVADTEYLICDSFTLEDELEVPSGSQTVLQAPSRIEKITYTGAATFISSAAGSTANSGEVIISVQVDGNSTGTFCAINGHNLNIFEASVDNFALLGEARNAFVCGARFSRIRFNGGGFKFINTFSTLILQAVFRNSTTMDDAFLTIIGSSTALNITNSNFTRQAGEFAIYVDKGNSTNGVISQIVGAEGSGFFRSGITGDITGEANSGTDPGVKTTVTSNGHGLVLGQAVVITNTTNYNGSFILSNITTNTFDIEVIFGVNDGANGEWDSASLIEKDPNIQVINVAGQKDSKQIALGFMNNNSSFTTVSSNVYAALNLPSFSESIVTERFTLTTASAGLFTYTGTTQFDGFVNAIVRGETASNLETFQFAMSFNGGIPLFTAIGSTAITSVSSGTGGTAKFVHAGTTAPVGSFATVTGFTGTNQNYNQTGLVTFSDATSFEIDGVPFVATGTGNYTAAAANFMPLKVDSNALSISFIFSAKLRTSDTIQIMIAGVSTTESFKVTDFTFAAQD